MRATQNACIRGSLIAAIVFALYGCCAGPDSPTYTFRVLIAPDLGNGVQWNGTTSAAEADPALRVFLPRGAVPTREMLEFYDESGARVNVPGVLRHGISALGSCPQDGVDYSLESLADGLYTVVHRLSSAPTGLSTWDGPVGTFEDEPALVTTLMLGVRGSSSAESDPTRRDGGL